MATKQVYTPNLNVPAKSGWCLKYVDDGGKAPKRTPTADAARTVEQDAKRLKTGTPPVGVWVVGFLKLVGASGHVFFMKYKGSGVYEIHDSETRIGHHEGPYTSISQVLSWFHRYKPVYAGYSFQCDGRVYAETYTPTPKPAPKKPTSKLVIGKRIARKGTARVLVDMLNVRTGASTGSKVVATYKKGQTFTYDSYIITKGYVWLSYVSYGGVRHYVAEGPYDGNPKNVYVSGGIS